MLITKSKPAISVRFGDFDIQSITNVISIHTGLDGSGSIILRGFLLKDEVEITTAHLNNMIGFHDTLTVNFHGRILIGEETLLESFEISKGGNAFEAHFTQNLTTPGFRWQTE